DRIEQSRAVPIKTGQARPQNRYELTYTGINRPRTAHAQQHPQASETPESIGVAERADVFSFYFLFRFLCLWARVIPARKPATMPRASARGRLSINPARWAKVPIAPPMSMPRTR